MFFSKLKITTYFLINYIFFIKLLFIEINSFQIINLNILVFILKFVYLNFLYIFKKFCHIINFRILSKFQKIQKIQFK